MAIFNPDPQGVQIEDDRSYSHPISPVEGNKAWGTALTGVGQMESHAGELIQDIGKVQEFNTRQDIANSQELATSNARRDANITAYENANALNEQPRATVNPPDKDSPLDLIPAQDQAPLPGALANLPQKASAQAQAKLDNRVNQAYLTANIDMDKKALRARYPDHADYIDHVYKQAGFGDTANERYKAAQALYLARQSAINDETKTAIAFGHSHMDTPDVDTYIEDVRQGKPGAIQRLESHINRYESYKSGLKLKVDQLHADNEFAADGALKATDDFSIGIMNAGIQSQYERDGLDNYKAINDKVTELQNNPQSISKESVADLGLRIDAMKRRDYAYIMKQLSQPQYSNFVEAQPSGRSIMALSGDPEKVKARVLAQLSKYDQLQEAVNNHDWGLAAYIPAQIKAQANNDVWSMSNSDVNFRLAKAFTTMNPQVGADWYQRHYAELNEAGNAWAARTTAKMATEGAPLSDTYKTLIDNKASPAAALHFLRPLEEFKGNSKLSDDSLRANAKSFFDAANNGVLKNFPEDRVVVDGNETKIIPGRLSIFKQMTDPAYAATMKHLGDDTWKMYKSWAENEFRGSILVGKLKSLEQLSHSPDYQVGWNDKSGQFEFKTTPEYDAQVRRATSGLRHNRPLAGIENPDIPQAQALIAQINSGAQSVNNIAKQDGATATSYMLKTLKSLDIDFSGFTGLPQEMHRAVINSTMIPSIRTDEIRFGETPAQAIARKKAEEMKPQVP